MANGLLTARKNVTHATGRPPSRRPANQNSGSDATDVTPDRARTAKSLRPKTAIQACRRT